MRIRGTLPNAMGHKEAIASFAVRVRLFVMGGFGLIAAVAFAAMALLCWTRLQGLPAQPVSMTSSEIAARLDENERLWVAVQDGTWDCASPGWYRGYPRFVTQAALVGSEGTVITVVRFRASDRLTCATLPSPPVVGEIEQMTATQRATLAADLAKYGEATTFLELCAYCGRRNTTIGAVFSTIMSVGGLACLVCALLDFGRQLDRSGTTAEPKIEPTARGRLWQSAQPDSHKEAHS